jgi:hypothetical protein
MKVDNLKRRGRGSAANFNNIDWSRKFENGDPAREHDGFNRIVHHHHENQDKGDQGAAHNNQALHDQPSKKSEFTKLKNNLRKDETKLKDYLREDENLGEEGRTCGGSMK